MIVEILWSDMDRNVYLRNWMKRQEVDPII